MAKILITGGTGSLGTALVKHWYSQHELTIVSRDPHKQARMTAEFPNVRYILADICNGGEMRRACEGQDILIHAAALKDVSTGEFHPSEFARVNVQGTITVAEAWRHSHWRTGKALLVSSDKACSALNTYGATKKVSEGVFRKYDYSVIRYGNVVESAGSFVHKWQAARDSGKPIQVRSPEPTRFFLRMSEAVALIENALDLLTIKQGGIFVPHGLKAFSIWDAAKATGLPVEYGPLLPYEKQHETLLAEGEQAHKETALLSRITPGWGGDWRAFRSSDAPRMRGEEVLEALGWN